VASAHAEHVAEIEVLQDALQAIKRRERLSAIHRRTIRFAQEEWHEFLRPGAPPSATAKLRRFDAEEAVEFALLLREKHLSAGTAIRSQTVKSARQG